MALGELLPTATRTIGARTFIVSALPTVHGRRLFFKLVKIVGPSLTKFIASIEGEDIAQANARTLAAAAEELIKSLDESTFDDFYDTFASHTQVSTEHGQVPFARVSATVFSGDYGSMVKWLAFCLEFNYASFFGDLGLTNRLA